MANAFVTSSDWGDLFRDKAVEDCFSSASSRVHWLAFESAWTQALGETQGASAEAVEAALAAISAFDVPEDDLAQGSGRDGLPIPELVRRLRSGLDRDAAKAIHTGATSQDVIDTGLVLASVACLTLFTSRLECILARLDELDKAFGQRSLQARTRMQAALPVTVRDRIRIWTAPLRGLRADLSGMIENVSALQIGGPVGLGVADDTFAEAVAQKLGLALADVWHTDRRRTADIGHWLMKLAGALGKLGQDIALMAQQGVDEVQIKGAGGSSAMPHKQNPVRAEILVALARVSAGQQGTLAQALVHEQERSGAAWAIEWMVLPAMFETAGAALNNTEALLDQITSLGSAR